MSKFPDTLFIYNDSIEDDRVNFDGYLKLEVLESTDTQYQIKCNVLADLQPFWIDKTEAQTLENIDPNKVIRWLFKQLNKALNGQDND